MNEINEIDNTPPPQSQNDFFKKIKESSTGVVPNYQTILIVILTIFLILALLGINVFIAIGNLFQSAFDVIKPITYNTISDIGYTTGSVINSTSNVATDTTKKGLDIVNGTIHNIGNLLIESSDKEVKKEGLTNYSLIEPVASTSESYSSRYVAINKDAYLTNSIYDPTKYASIN